MSVKWFQVDRKAPLKRWRWTGPRIGVGFWEIPNKIIEVCQPEEREVNHDQIYLDYIHVVSP